MGGGFVPWSRGTGQYGRCAAIILHLPGMHMNLPNSLCDLVLILFPPTEGQGRPRWFPISHNHISYDESYNVRLDLNVSIADVILTIRLKNALDRLPIDGNYSLNNSDLFNPMNSLLSFGIIWEFDD